MSKPSSNPSSPGVVMSQPSQQPINPPLVAVSAAQIPIAASPIPLARALMPQGNVPIARGPAPVAVSNMPLTRVSLSQQPTFVNLAAATNIGSKVRPDGTALRPQLQVTSVGGSLQHLSGAINLTITNGSVNLRGAGPAGTGRPEILQGQQAVIRANISGPGSLQRLPLQLQTTTGMKINPIKLHPINLNQGMNLRLAVPPASGAQGLKPKLVPIGQLSPPASMLQQVNIPVMIPGGKFPIAHLQPLTLRPVTSINSVPGSVTATLQASNAITYSRTGVSSTATATNSTANKKPETAVVALTTQIQPTDLSAKDLTKKKTVALKPKLQPILPRKSGEEKLRYDEYYLLDDDGNLHYQKELRANCFRDIKQKDGSVLRWKIFDGFRPGPDDYISPEEMTRIENLKKNCIKIKLQDGKKMLEERQKKKSGSGANNGKTEGPSETKAPPRESESDSEEESSEEEEESSEEESEEEDKEEAVEENGDESESESVAPNNPPEEEASLGVLDDGLEWKDGIGTLPGSDMKFRKNEFGILEMITDFDEGERMDTGREGGEQALKPDGTTTGGADICCCESCGIHGLSQDFLSGGRFCSRRCVSIHASKHGAAARKVPTNIPAKPGPPGKRKKRKISAESDDLTGAKVPRMKVDDDAVSTCSTESTPRKVDDPVALKSKTTVPPGGKRARSFSWSKYLEQENAIAAPTKLFREYQSVCDERNMFKIGMKLEAIDPRLPAMYCMATVVEVRGYRIRLHFDGYDGYDFWTNANSPFIFPIGWSERNNKPLQPPKMYVGKMFDIQDYLKLHRAIAAPKGLFSTTSANSITPHGFRVGHKLEAVDKKNSSLICVATVADVLGDNILIHFDGWDSVYDYWCDPTSPYIHPVGWCQENNVTLSPPQDWKDVESFTWEEYLDMEKVQPVPARAFKLRNPNGLEVGMRLEVVDRRNPVLVRAATVAEVEAFSIRVHFDGWSDVYDYFVDDDCPDIHPCGWCARTGHPLTPPLTPKDLMVTKNEGCPTPGCTGIGHIKGSKYTGHHSAFGCPYTLANIKKETPLSDRLMFSGDLYETYKKGKKAAEPCSPVERKEEPADIKPDLDAELTQHLLENHGKPLYGKGSGRGRKKTIVKLMQEVEQLRAKANAHQLQHSSFQPVHNPTHLTNGVLDSVVTSPPVLGTPMALPPLHLTNGTLEPGGVIHQSVFTPPTSAPHPYHDLPLGWEQSHSKLMPDILQYKPRDVSTWDAHQVAEFVARLPGCDKVARDLEEQDIDGEALLLLNQADMVRVLDMKLGPALKIHNTILTLKNNLDV